MEGTGRIKICVEAAVVAGSGTAAAVVAESSCWASP